MVWQEYGIAAGHGGSPVNIESITDASSNPLAKFSVVGKGGYSQGEPFTKADGTIAYMGYPFTVWTWEVMHWSGCEYLYTTILSGAQSGLVTINTTLEDPTVYANMNATMILPNQSELQHAPSGQYYENVIVRFTRLETP